MCRFVLLLACLMPLSAAAQLRLGVLNFTQTTPTVETALRDALREEGYVEGQNMRIVWRSADGRRDRARTLAQELTALKVEIIIAMLTPAVQAAKEATSSIPIIMASAGDPLGTGFVASFAKPGGNITGVAGFGAELSGKRIQFVQQLLPGIHRIGLLTNSRDPFAKSFIAESRAAAAQAGIELYIADVTRPEEVDAAIAAMKNEKVGAMIVQGVLTGPDWKVASLALRRRLPAVSFVKPFAESGGLAYYSGSSRETYRRAASFVRRIQQGATPAELPVERPTQTELVINLRTAKELGLALAQDVLLSADQLLK